MTTFRVIDPEGKYHIAPPSMTDGDIANTLCGKKVQFEELVTVTNSQNLCKICRQTAIGRMQVAFFEASEVMSKMKIALATLVEEVEDLL